MFGGLLRCLNIIKITGYLLVLLTLTRLFFIAVNRSSFYDMTTFTVLKVCSYGLIFDLNTIFYFNAFIFLIISLPLPPKIYSYVNVFVKCAIIIINSFIFLFEIADAIYFRFSNRRSSFDVIDIINKSGFFKQVPHYVITYWYAVAITAAFIFILIKRYPEQFNYGEDPEPFNSKLFLMQVLTMLLLALNVTSFYTNVGFGLKQLRKEHLVYLSGMQNLPFSFNSTFSLLNSSGKTALPDPKFFSQGDVTGYFNPIEHFSNKAPFIDRNVVVIILESFAKDFVTGYKGQGSFAPFLNSLLKDSVTFENSFTNCFRTNDAVPAVLSGIPVLMDTGFIDSIYSENHIRGLAELLGNKGYYTAFFHGGISNLFGFDYYAKLALFNEYNSMNEYPEKSDYDGSRAIFDEPYLQYVAKRLNRFKEPFFASVLTASSHDPYIIPSKFKGKFPKGPSNYCESIGYSDYALKRFFESAKQMPWYNNTLFVIMADHPVDSGVRKGEALYDQIPLAFYSPGHALPPATTSLIQQIDVMPSILNILNYAEPFFAFGKSAFEDKYEHCAYNLKLNRYAMYCGDYALNIDLHQTIGFYNFKDDPNFTNNLLNDIKISKTRTKMENSLKAVIQTFNVRMNSNSF